jgi:acyl-CoA synthetase (AMP-forming)/AMP-acid ligase II
MRQPKSLFQFIHKYLGTFCFMPNFAFNHSVRSIRQSDLEGVDLSCLRRLINSSEAVRLDTLEGFIERFAPYGLRDTAVGVGYGATETSGGASLTPCDCRSRVDWIDLKNLQKTGRAVPFNEGLAIQSDFV